MSAEFGTQGPVGCSVDICNWMNVYNQLLDGFKQEVVAGGGELDEETIKVVRQKASREFMTDYVRDVKSIVREWSQVEVVESDVEYVRSEFGYQIRRKDTQEVIGSTGEMFIQKRQELGKEDTEESLTLKQAFKEVETNGEVYFPVHNQTDGKDAVRYVAHWVKEGDVIKPEMLRIARDGDDKSLPEVHEMLANTLGLDGYKEVRQSERAFVYVKSQEAVHDDKKSGLSYELTQTDVVSTLKDRVDVSNLESEPVGSDSAFDKKAGSVVVDLRIEAVKDEDLVGREEKIVEPIEERRFSDDSSQDVVTRVIEKVADDMKQTVSEVAVYLGNKKKKEIGSKGESREFMSERATKIVPESMNLKNKDREVKTTGERLTIDKIRARPVDIRQEIDRRYSEMVRTVAQLRMVSETKAAIGAVPLLLRSLSERPSVNITAVDKSLRRRIRSYGATDKLTGIQIKAKGGLKDSELRRMRRRLKLVAGPTRENVRLRSLKQKVDDKVQIGEKLINTYIKTVSLRRIGISLPAGRTPPEALVDRVPPRLQRWSTKRRQVPGRNDSIEMTSKKEVKFDKMQRLGPERKNKRKIKSERLILKQRRRMRGLSSIEVESRRLLKENERVVLSRNNSSDSVRVETRGNKMAVESRKMRKLKRVAGLLVHKYNRFSDSGHQPAAPYPKLLHRCRGVHEALLVGARVTGFDMSKKIQLREKSVKKKEALVGLSLSWALMMLVGSTVSRNLSSRSRWSPGEATFLRLLRPPPRRGPRNDTLLSTKVEFQPWLLLSIIYYLAMLREQGNNKQGIWQKAKGKGKSKLKLYKKKKSSGYGIRDEFPRTGVIFAALS